MKLYLKACLCCFLSLLLVNDVVAQTCKYVDEKKDAFTGETVKSGTFSIGLGGRITLQKKKEVYSIGFYFVVSGFIEKKILTGDTVYIKLADDKMVKVVADKDIDPVLSGANGSPFTQWVMMVDVDPKMMKRMANHDAIAIKFTIGGTDYVYSKFTVKLVDRLKDSALCLLSE